MRNILIVNDDADLLDTYHMPLERRNYRAVPAESTEEALEYSRKEKLDPVLTNLSRSGIDGWEFVERVKSNPETGQIPIMVANGKSLTLDQLRRHAHLMDASLQMPFTAIALKETIESVLNKKSSSKRRDTNKFEKV